MSWPRSSVRAVVFAVALTSAAASAFAQVWTADLYAGGTRYDALASRVSSTNLVGNVRYQTTTTLAYAALAAPLDRNAAVWSALGGTRRFESSPVRRFGYGIELGAHGYAFRGATSTSGGGASLDALPFVSLTSAGLAFELSAGRHQHVYSYSDTSGGRGVTEVAANATMTRSNFAAQAQARWLHAAEATYPHVGIDVVTALGSARVWGSAGKWLTDELSDVTWSVGASMTVLRSNEVWLSVRQDAMDPLYRNAARRAWNVGVSRRIGGPRVAAPELTPRVVPEGVRIVLPASLAPGSDSVYVAGEFSDWKPLSMRRDNGVWMILLPLRSGVHRFAFVSKGGEWFVPERYPGRIDDGMGGHVAVLVVP